MLKQVESFEINLPITFPSLICGILIKQKIDTLIGDDNVGIPPSPLNFIYKLIAGKHV